MGLISLDERSQTILRDCFRQAGIEAAALSPESVDEEKFEAFVVLLDSPSVSTLLESIRQSPRNCRVVLYGLSSDSKAAFKYSGYGINVILPCPVERQATLRAVRATRLLVLNELRRYVRIPIAVEVRVDHSQGRFNTTSLEVSGGGMSLTIPDGVRVNVSSSVQVSFALPSSPEISMSGSVCWHASAGAALGIRFGPAEKDKQVVWEWVENYLQLREKI